MFSLPRLLLRQESCLSDKAARFGPWSTLILTVLVSGKVHVWGIPLGPILLVHTTSKPFAHHHHPTSYTPQSLPSKKHLLAPSTVVQEPGPSLSASPRGHDTLSCCASYRIRRRVAPAVVPTQQSSVSSAEAVSRKFCQWADFAFLVARKYARFAAMAVSRVVWCRAAA